MAIFLLSLVDHERGAELETKLKEKEIPYKEISKGCYLLSSKTLVLPRDMYEAINIQNDELGQVLIVRFDSYWGFHDSNVWDWIKGVQ